MPGGMMASLFTISSPENAGWRRSLPCSAARPNAAYNPPRCLEEVDLGKDRPD
jgi:hypothetical protein